MNSSNISSGQVKQTFGYEIQREHNAVIQRRKAAELAAKKKAEEEAALRLKQRKETDAAVCGSQHWRHHSSIT